MYGKLTRQVEDWFPSNLVCKRFNLKNPHIGRQQPEKKQSQTEEMFQGIQFAQGLIEGGESQDSSV
jgi:hypothetical protein